MGELWREVSLDRGEVERERERERRLERESEGLRRLWS